MNARWWEAILFVTSLAAYAAAMWILLAFARHAHRVILIMLDTGYYWKDSTAILRRETRRAHEPRPGAHRAPKPKQRKRAAAEILAIEDSPWPPDLDVADAIRDVPPAEFVAEARRRVDDQADTDILGDEVPSNVTVQRDPTVPMGMAPTDLPVTTITMEARRG